ncbi:UNVERIFIED_CONTAM: hypothetical protein Sangu_2925200 [Sesamum angustifolium]|uniref:Uncharacterized protein n=1 Tax=Sesamum angustifolium TaxID=2727405 RepID=A0AAW2IMS4_9LAMI
MRVRSTRRALPWIHGYQRGIEANPLKIKAILDMKALTNVNEVQKLTGKIAALSRFISKAAEKAERRYTPIEKMALALGKSDTSRRLVNWAVELNEYDISYMIRKTIKAQALANFISEMARAPMEDASKAEKWLLHVD